MNTRRDISSFMVAVGMVVIASFVGCLAALALVSALFGLFA